MSLSALEIGEVVEILRRDLIGAVVRSIISPTAPDRLIIEIRTQGQNHFLQLVISAMSSRIGRIEQIPVKAQRPHPFAMLLRRDFEGLFIEDICQMSGDRVVRIDAIGKDKKGSLIIELTSRHANIFWLDSKGKIAGSFFVNRSFKRNLNPGFPYMPPIARSLEHTVLKRFKSSENLEKEIEAHYETFEKTQKQESQKAITQRLLTTAHRHLERLAFNLQNDKERAAEGERLADMGHLLKANLHLAKKGFDRLRVIDFEGLEAEITLDPRLGPVANMQRFFDKSKRLTQALSMIKTRLEEVEAKRKTIEKLELKIDKADEIELSLIENEIHKLVPGLSKQPTGRRAQKPERLPYREYAISSGRYARVGRSAGDNDALTLHFAKPDDLWLHVRGRPGSHVVVPMGRGEDPSEPILIDAAHLAAHFSGVSEDDLVEVVYTRRRYVQKPKGAAKGSVRLLREKTLLLRIEPKRLERILALKAT